jgi:hypothetical protein
MVKDGIVLTELQFWQFSCVPTHKFQRNRRLGDPSLFVVIRPGLDRYLKRLPAS